MPPEILELEPGKLMLIGIGLALMTLILVGLGYCIARIFTPSASDRENEAPDADELVSPLDRDSERDEVVRHLAARVTHDFNNIVFAISGRIQILRRTTDDQAILSALDEMQKSLDGSTGILGALRTISQQPGSDATDLAIGPELHELVDQASTVLPPEITLTTSIEVADTTEVRMDRESLQQVLMSVLANSVEAIGTNPGRIQIALHAPDESDHPFLRLVIDDDGPGIPAHQRAEAFTSFHSTKDDRPMSGLGLAIAKRLLNERGASICLEDSPLGGLRVEVRLAMTAES